MFFVIASCREQGYYGSRGILRIYSGVDTKKSVTVFLIALPETLYILPSLISENDEYHGKLGSY